VEVGAVLGTTASPWRAPFEEGVRSRGGKLDVLDTVLPLFLSLKQRILILVRVL